MWLVVRVWARVGVRTSVRVAWLLVAVRGSYAESPKEPRVEGALTTKFCFHPLATGCCCCSPASFEV